MSGRGYGVNHKGGYRAARAAKKHYQRKNGPKSIIDKAFSF